MQPLEAGSVKRYSGSQRTSGSCGRPGWVSMRFRPRATPPTWFCHPPPVVSIRSMPRHDGPDLRRRPTKAAEVAQRAHERGGEDAAGARPDPFGTAASSEISMPPPNSSSWLRRSAGAGSAWNSGRKPARASAALAIENASSGSPPRRASNVVIRSSTPRSIERKTICGSEETLANACTGSLSVQVDRNIDHSPAMSQAVGRGVGPAARQIEPNRAAAPKNLVVQQSSPRAARPLPNVLQDRLPQEPEGLVLVGLPIAVPPSGARLPRTSAHGPVASTATTAWSGDRPAVVPGTPRAKDNRFQPSSTMSARSDWKNVLSSPNPKAYLRPD